MNGIEWKFIYSFLLVFFMYWNIKKFVKICIEKFLFCRKRKKNFVIKVKRKKFYDDEEMEVEIKVCGRLMENEKIN